MKRFIYSVIAALVALTALGLSVGTASADMTGIEKVDTPLLVEAFARVVNQQLVAAGEEPVEWAIRPNTRLDVTQVRVNQPIPVSLEEMERLRGEAQLAPLAKMSLDALRRIQQVATHATNDELATKMMRAARACFAGAVIAFVERAFGFVQTVVDSGAYNRVVTSGVDVTWDWHEPLIQGFTDGYVMGAATCRDLH